jgi:peptidoglycan/xylan/chitin deacetylase (PgdA/CDA1 family)
MPVVSRLARAATGVAAAALAAQYVPSTVILGQWTSLRALPGGWCRWRGPADTGAVALTFDDGPDPEATPAVLDELDRFGLRATFFCLASHAERWPDLVAETMARGHAVGTHGFRHGHHLARTPRWIADDLRAAGDVMARLGFPVHWYRPSYGQATGATLVAARLQGLHTVLWSAWGREWATHDSAEVATRITRRLGPGAVVLLHDGDTFGTAGMWRVGLGALPAVAAHLERHGLAAVTLDELVPKSGGGASVSGGNG